MRTVRDEYNTRLCVITAEVFTTALVADRLSFSLSKRGLCEFDAFNHVSLQPFFITEHN